MTTLIFLKLNIPIFPCSPIFTSINFHVNTTIYHENGSYNWLICWNSKIQLSVHIMDFGTLTNFILCISIVPTLLMIFLYRSMFEPFQRRNQGICCSNFAFLLNIELSTINLPHSFIIFEYIIDVACYYAKPILLGPYNYD